MSDELKKVLEDLEALRVKFKEYGDNHLRFCHGHPGLTYDKGYGDAFLACSSDIERLLKGVKR